MMHRLVLILALFFTFETFSQTIPWLSKETLTGGHDPSIIKDERGVYTLLSTNNMLELRQSDNLVNWRVVGKVISRVPSYMNNVGNIWAPHIYFRNGRYWVYYCGSSFGSNNSWIGVASSPTLNTAAANYLWTDHGEVIKSTTSNNYNCIDPELIVDYDNKVWMAFGSFWSGLKIIAIDPASGKQLASNRTIYSIASRGGGAIEAPALSKNNGYYYQFIAWDRCCAGLESTYRTMVGRSKTITGPYLDKASKDLNNSGGTQMIASYGRYIGTGHGSPFEDGRRTYFVHHYYNGNQNGAPNIQIREVVYDNEDWPIITQPFLGRRQSFEAEHAKFINADIITTNSASNSEYIGGIDAVDSRVVFHINALQGGEYTVRIRFSSPSGASSQFLKVNSSTETEISYPASPATVDFPESRVMLKTVTLNEGYNILSFRKGSGVAHLDRIDLIRSAKNALEGGSFDDSKVVDYVATGNNAAFSSGDWAKFENIDFGQGENTNAIFSFSGSCNGQIKLNIDGVNGTITTSGAVDIADAQIHSIPMPVAIANLKGIHDLYMTYTGTGGCGIDNFKFGSNTVTSLERDQESLNISIYPNPFTETFEILSESEVHYEVLNVLGKQVATGVCKGLSVISGLHEKGTYIVRITKEGQQTEIRKLIKH